MFAPLPDRKYSVIYADPPWKYDNQGQQGVTDPHYGTLTIEEIKMLPVASVAADPCILFMWCTWPFMTRWNEVIEAWGFTYKTLAFDWVKTYRNGQPCFGVGAYTRSNSEVCLLATRGAGAQLIVDRSVSNVQLAERGAHSAKPNLFRELITQLTGDVPKLELFGRTECRGWDVWGNGVVPDLSINLLEF